MRILIQKVNKASVKVEGSIKSRIGNGLVILLGIEYSDSEEDITWLCNKIINLRIFEDVDGIMNLSAIDTDAEIMVVSQFTLFASTKKGNRPSYIKASKPNIAKPMYERFCNYLEQTIGKEVKTGLFGAHMELEIINSGPTTIWIDSKERE